MTAEAARIPEAFSRRRLMASSMALGIRQAGVAGVTAVGVLILSRLLHPAQFAFYGWTMAVVGAVFAVGDLGYGGALIRSGRASELAAAAISRHQRRVLPIAGLAGLAIALVPVSATVRVSALLLDLTALLLAIQMVPTAVFEADGRFAAIGAIEVLQRLVLIAGAVALAAAFASGWAAPAAAALSAAVGAGLTRTLARTPPRARSGADAHRLDLGFSRSWLTGRVAGQINYGVYPVVGTVLLSTRQLGLVLWALSVSSLPALGSHLSARVLFPAIVTRDPAAQQVHRKVIAALLLLGAPLVGAMIVFAQPLTRLVFGSSWLGAVTVLRVECVNTALGLVLTPLIPVLFLLARPALAGRLLMLYAGFTWALAALLAGPFGLGVVAISIGTLISTAAMLLAADVALVRAGAPRLDPLAAPLIVIGALTALGLAWDPAIGSLYALVPALLAWTAIGVAAVLPFRGWLSR